MTKLRLLVFLLLAAAVTVSATPPSIALPNCESKCGDVDIPHPFGIGPNCFYNASFEVACNTSFNPSKPFLRQFSLELLEVNLISETCTLYFPIGATNSKCPQGKVTGVANFTSISFKGSPFRFSGTNLFTVVGCDNALLTSDGKFMAICSSECVKSNFTNKWSGCYGLDCCQTLIAADIDSYSVNISGDARKCTKAFLSAGKWYSRNLSNEIYDIDHATVDINWSPRGQVSIIGENETKYPFYNCFTTSESGYHPCTCGWAYEGNPYIPNGCKIAQACAKCEKECSRRPRGELYCNRTHKTEIILGSALGGGLLITLLSVFCFWLYKVIKKNKIIKRKKKFFKRNGGLKLEQQISSDETKAEKTMIFNSEVLEKATDNFNANRILGEGGQGTVYKGMFTDGRIVAIKKSKVIDESQLEVFINEVVILSQINHRNIVKLLGCCLVSPLHKIILLTSTLGTDGQGRKQDFSGGRYTQIFYPMRFKCGGSGATTPIFFKDVIYLS